TVIIKYIYTGSGELIVRQVILDLATAVKELVENGLDAQAKVIGENILLIANKRVLLQALEVNIFRVFFCQIEIRFKEYGIQSIEVIDDGTGINQNCFEQLGGSFSSTKLFVNRLFVNFYGYQREALSSLCALSKVMILTCTQEEAPAGFKLEFDSLGKLIKKTPIALLSTSGNSNIRDNIANLFGAKTLTQIVPFDFNIQVTPEKQKMLIDSENQPE
ncbi:6554_t:CDS:2, partial [Racocetra fulgida]